MSPLPMLPPQEGAFPPGDGRFRCNLCGWCCTHLQEREREEWPSEFDRLARIGFYRLPTRAGLQVWGWEKRRMESAAQRRGHAIQFVPSMMIMDDARARIIVAVWELTTMACPLTDPGPGEGTIVCGAYAERPGICRAFPVLSRGGEITYSSKCDAAFAPPGEGRAGYAETYAESFAAAEAVLALPRHVQRTLAFLETVGEVRPARGLERASVLARLARWPHVDLMDVLAQSSAVPLDRFLAQVPEVLQ